jgi:hypothetical protein
MIKIIREICNKCLKQFPDVLININYFRYCKDCSNILFKIGVNKKALITGYGKGKNYLN